MYGDMWVADIGGDGEFDTCGVGYGEYGGIDDVESIWGLEKFDS